MPKPRKQLISLADTPYYHCIARCVRRAFLCGDDKYIGQNFDHRKDWLVARIKYLASVFSIDVCAYAVMPNHYHLVLYVNAEKSEQWQSHEVCKRWRALFPTSADNLIKLHTNAKNNADEAAIVACEAKIETWRSRLADISWFMRCLNEFIARQANQEDNCTGRFWEGRFKSQALLDEHALLTCMAYVDLNPVRARLADTPEESEFTSIQERIADYAKNLPKKHRSKTHNKLIRQQQSAVAEYGIYDWPQAKLKPLNGCAYAPLSRATPFTREEYFKLVDIAGRVVRRDKHGAIDAKFLPILQRLGFEEASWINCVTQFNEIYSASGASTECLSRHTDRQERPLLSANRTYSEQSVATPLVA